MKKIYFDDTLIDTSYYGGLVKSAEVFNQTFKLGATICETYKFTVDKSIISNKEPSVVYLYNDDVLEKTLFVDNYKEEDFTITYELTDAMVNFNFGYDASPLVTGGGATLLEVFQDICSKANISTDIASFDFDDMNITWYDNSIMARDYLSFIGENNASYLYITADNKLAMKSVNTIAVRNYDFDEIGKYKIGQKHKFSRVVLNNGLNYITAGDDTGDTYYINVSNVYVINQDVVDNIYNKIKDYEFYDVEIENLPTFNLTSAGDNVTITDNYGNVYNTIMRYESLTLSGSDWYGGLKNTLDTSKQEETEIIGQKRIIKSIKNIVDRDSNTITTLIKETQDIQTDLRENYYTLEQTNELVQNSATGITNTFSEAGGNNIFRNTGLWFANNQTDEEEVTSENGKIEVEDAINRDANETKVYGKIEQDANPSPDYPQEIKTVSGIGNLFDINSTPFIPRVAYNSSGVQQNWDNYSGTTTKTPIQSSTTYTITEDKNTYTTYIVEYDSSETFIQRIVLSNYNKTFTTSVNAKYINISISSEIVPTKAQIEQGTISHTQVPYGHWLPVKVGNKNLFDSEHSYNYTISTSNHVVFQQANRYGFLVKVKPNTTYTFSRSDVGTASLNFIALLNDFVYGVDNPYIDAVNIGSALTYTITTTNDTNYIMILTGAGYSSDVQLEESPIVTDYIQHEEQTILIDLNKYDENNNIIGNYEICSIGDTKDLLTIKNGKAVLNKNINNIVLNGSENWLENTPRFALELTGYASGTYRVYSDKFTYANAWQTHTKTNNTTILYKDSAWNAARISFNYNGVANVNEWKNWLSTHNTEVYYLLATPETITLNGVYNINLYEGVNHITIEDDDLIPTFNIKYYTRFMVYDFWEGEVERIRENKSSNRNAMSLQNGILYQDELVPNGNYTISFKYKKLISLATAKVIINNTEYELTETEDTEFEQNFAVNSQNIRVEFVCDVNDGCEVYDLMVNAGSVKLAYSQNQNETTTSTVNISKGITITSSDLDVKFKADADGIRTLDSNDTELTKFTDKGMTTKEAIIQSKSQIVGTLWQEVGGQTWITRL